MPLILALGSISASRGEPGPALASPGSLDVTTYKIGTLHTITAGTANATGGGTVSYELQWLVNDVQVAFEDAGPTTLAYEFDAGDDELLAEAQWRAVETGGTNPGATAWQPVGSGTVTYVAPTFSNQPSITPAQAEPGSNFTFTGSTDVDFTPTDELVTFDGNDISGDLVSGVYTSTVDGALAFQQRKTNSGGTVLSNLVQAAVNTLPVVTGLALDTGQSPAILSGNTTEFGDAWGYFDASATPVAGATIRSTVQAATPALYFGPISVDEFSPSFPITGLAALGPGTFYLHFTIEDNNSGYSVDPVLETILARPTIISASPADDATGVAVDAPLTITFSEPVIFGTGNIILRDNDGGFADLEVFDVETDVGTSPGQVNISGAVLTIYPTANFAAGIEHARRIASTAITDIHGLAFAGIADDTTLSFTTAGGSITAPTYIGADSVRSSANAYNMNWPAGHDTGDRAFAVIACRGDQGPPATPTGWTLVDTRDFSSNNSLMHDSILVTRVAESDAEAAVAIADTGAAQSSLMSVWRGVDSYTLHASGELSNAATLVIPGATTAQANSRLAQFLSVYDVDGLTTSQISAGPTNGDLTDIQTAGNHYLTGPGGGHYHVNGLKAAAGLVGSTSITFNQADAGSYYTIELKGVAS